MDHSSALEGSSVEDDLEADTSCNTVAAESMAESPKPQQGDNVQSSIDLNKESGISYARFHALLATSVGDDKSISEAGQGPSRIDYKYDYELHKYVCLVDNCGYSIGKRERFERHRMRSHQIMKEVEGAKRGRPWKDGQGPQRPGRESEMYYARNTLDPEWRYRNGLRRYLQTCRKNAKKVFQGLVDDDCMRSECEETFVKDFVERRRVAWESKRADRIETIRKNIRRDWCVDDADVLEWESEINTLDYQMLACGRLEATKEDGIAGLKADIHAPTCSMSKGLGASNALEPVPIDASQSTPLKVSPLSLVAGDSPGDGKENPGEPRITALILREDWTLEVSFFDLVADWYNMCQGGNKKGRAVRYNCKWPLFVKSPLWKQGKVSHGEFSVDLVDVVAFETIASDTPQTSKTSWVNNQSVGVYLMIISHTIPYNMRVHHQWLHPSSMGLLMLNNDHWRNLLPPRPCSHLHDSRRVEQIQYYWLPVNHESHWSLFVLVNEPNVCKELRLACPSFLHFDSIRGCHGYIYRWLPIFFGALFSSWSYDNAAIMNAHVISLDTPQQRNSSDCGVWTILYARSFLKDFIMRGANAEGVQIGRNWIAEVDLNLTRKTFGMMLDKFHEIVWQQQEDDALA